MKDFDILMSNLNLLDKDFLKWLINQGVSFIVLSAFTISFMYLSFKYVPQFVGHVGNLAHATENIDTHLARIAVDTDAIKDKNDKMSKKLESIEALVIQNNVLLKNNP